MTIAETLDKKYGNSVPSMTIAEALGGSKGQTISDALNILNTLYFTPVTDDSVDLLGKVASDLQEDVSIARRKVSGTLHYLDDYTGFSGLPEEQEGNYVALQVVPPTDMTIGTDITVKINGKPLDSDGIVIIRMNNKVGKKIIFSAGANGYDTVMFALDMSGLVFEPAEDDSEEESNS